MVVMVVVTLAVLIHTEVMVVMLMVSIHMEVMVERKRGEI